LDDAFHSAGDLFELEIAGWLSGARDFGRLADWAILPADALPSELPDRAGSP
jgi:hypothetical protein